MLAAGAAGRAKAQDAAQQTEGEPFTFDWLTDRMRRLSREEYQPAPAPEGFLSTLTYDDYRNIQFRTERARWSDTDAPFELHAYHLGWLFKEPVEIFEVIDGRASPLTFGTDDFKYYNGLAEKVPEHTDMPGVAGFRLNAPLNSERYDEVISFLGASYFRALAKGNVYGLSARGLAVNTAMGDAEEFPRFSAFWLERPEPGADRVVFYASLDSPSVTGAYRFVLHPGETTRVDVVARLFLRENVRQLGIAPLTSMYLFGPNDSGPFDDYRPSVHDSEVLVMHSASETFVRPLNNPPRLANSYLGALNPVAFGLEQRNRAFDDYLDAGAHYERRPSLVVEPVGEWGRGAVRLIEIPSDLEANDNIVAFWAPEGGAKAGDALEYAYRLHWGLDPMPERYQIAKVVRTLVGKGGVSGVKPSETRRKFVIDFAGGDLGELDPETDVKPLVDATGGTLAETVLTRIDGTGTWRLVLEVEAEESAVVELKASLALDEQRLTETWLYQWMKE